MKNVSLKLKFLQLFVLQLQTPHGTWDIQTDAGGPTNPTRDMGHTDRCRWPHNNDWYRAHGTWHASDSSRWTPGSQTPIAAN